MWVVIVFFFFFKQKTAYEMRISDWSSDVCSSDLLSLAFGDMYRVRGESTKAIEQYTRALEDPAFAADANIGIANVRSEEHTSELQSLMRISYAVFCLKKKNTTKNYQHTK